MQAWYGTRRNNSCLLPLTHTWQCLQPPTAPLVVGSLRIHVSARHTHLSSPVRKNTAGCLLRTVIIRTSHLLITVPVRVFIVHTGSTSSDVIPYQTHTFGCHLLLLARQAIVICVMLIVVAGFVIATLVWRRHKRTQQHVATGMHMRSMSTRRNGTGKNCLHH